MSNVLYKQFAYAIILLLVGFTMGVGSFTIATHIMDKPYGVYSVDKYERVMTSGEDAYLRLSRMGMTNWSVACAVEVGKKGGTYKDARRQCSSDYIEFIRDRKNGEPRLSPEEFEVAQGRRPS